MKTILPLLLLIARLGQVVGHCCGEGFYCPTKCIPVINICAGPCLPKGMQEQGKCFAQNNKGVCDILDNQCSPGSFPLAIPPKCNCQCVPLLPPGTCKATKGKGKVCRIEEDNCYEGWSPSARYPKCDCQCEQRRGWAKKVQYNTSIFHKKDPPSSKWVVLCYN